MVLIDGLVGSVVPEVLRPEADRLRLVVLLHMARDEPAEAAALASATAVVATSQWTKRRLSDSYGLPTERVHVVPPGVDRADLVAGTLSGGQLLCVGAVTPVKGQDVLLGGALASVEDLAWRCVCVGALDIDPEYVAGVRRQTEADGLGDRVLFTGALTGAELESAYTQADVLVLASRSETYGMVITEALARGLPVIVTDVGGVPEAVGHAVDGALPGVLVPPDDPHALGLAIRGWLTDPLERQRLRAAARSRRDTLGDWPRTTRNLAAVLTQIAG